jgi:hypothetical protein
LRLPEVVTSRYFCTNLLTSGRYVPVRASMFEPVILLPYGLEEAPSILPVPGPDTLSEWHPLRAAYWRQLDRTGLKAIAAELREISKRHGGRPVCVLDYEDLEKGHRSPRVVFGRWWTERTGVQVPEVTDDGRMLYHADLHRQVRGRPRVAAAPLPEPVGLSWPPSGEDLERWALAVPWKAARDERNPHEYALRRDADDRQFELVVLAIREFGYQQEYGGHEYTCLDVGGHFLWTMGDSLPTTLLINRKPISEKPRNPQEKPNEKSEAAAELSLSVPLFGREERT